MPVPPPSLLAVFAHPDDESLSAGGVLARPALSEVVGARKAWFSVSDEHVTATVDVRAWLDRKIAAVLAHRSEVQRGALPGVIAGLAPHARERLLATEWFIRHPPACVAPAQSELTV
ncbi:hypothetical protein [Streptomyces sp. AC602_WCS936]|uniref:hypothetical protein n=1 Tax=Streptomyces sp. AC602_WCS936 TaxID=2823685 RepID=UPI0035AEAF72